MQKTSKPLYLVLLFCVFFLSSNTRYQSIAGEVAQDQDSTRALPRNGIHAMIELLDFKNAEVKDVFRGLAKKYNLNIFVDDAIAQRITLHLSNISVENAIQFIAEENGLVLTCDNGIYKIMLPEIPKPQPKPLLIDYKDALLSLNIENEPLEKVVQRLSEISQRSILLNHGTSGSISGQLQSVPFETGLQLLMKTNGFVVREKNGVFIIERDGLARSGSSKESGPSFWIDVQDSLISLDVSNANLTDVILEISNQLDVDIFTYGKIEGQINAHCSLVPFESVLAYLFKGTNYTFRKEDNIYFIGDKGVSGIGSIRLIRLNYIKAEGIVELLPPSIARNATLQVIKEHNALMVVGAQDMIRETEAFIKEMDYPIPQILIEAIVVDFSTSDIGELGVTASWTADGSDTSGTINAGSLFPALNISASGDLINEAIDFHAPRLGIKKIGKLPNNFVLGLKALETQGKAKIRSRPQIATLNGHSASIKIGTTQYYQLESFQPIVGGNTAFTQTSQRFEKITAEISLTIVPWVSASGEITTEIKPEFSTPRGFDPKIPPTIDHRILESTVRLRDGETIVLGGLTKESDTESVQKIPFLGDLPIIGRLFQNKSHNKGQDELMIYITPHLNYAHDFDLNEEGIIQ